MKNNEVLRAEELKKSFKGKVEFMKIQIRTIPHEGLVIQKSIQAGEIG